MSIFSILKEFIQTPVVIINSNNNMVDYNVQFRRLLLVNEAQDGCLKGAQLDQFVSKASLREFKQYCSVRDNNKEIMLVFGDSCKIGFTASSLVLDGSIFHLLVSNQYNINIQELVDSLPGSVYWKDISGRYLGCNENVVKMAGLKNKSKIINKTDYELCWKEFADEWRDVDLEVIASKTLVQREEKIRFGDGKLGIELTHKAPLLNRKDEVIGIIGSSLDITELKNTQLSLEDALDKAQIANEVRDAIVANMRHDMNTPFSALYSLAAALAESEEDPERKEQQECVAEGAEFMLQHITKILSLIGAAEGNPPIASESIDLADIVSRVFNIYKLTAKDKGVKSELVCDNDAHLKKLAGDRFRVECFLMAILDNAIKFTGKNGAVKLSLHVEKIKESGPQTYVYVRFEIDDTGIGMDDEVLRQMHEPMYRANPAYNAKYAGAGTGLTIAKKYIEDMEGQILCKSSPGDGSKFVIIIPFALPYADDANEFVAG